MALSFKDLKKSQDQLESINKYTEELNKKGNFKRDERYWRPTKDSDGNGSAVIRFIPCADEVPYVKKYSYSFKGKGGWYIENSPTTLKLPDPVADYNSRLWEAGQEDEARKRSRRLGFIANILVVNDPGNPENNGKVFLYEFGKKLMDKLQAKMNPKNAVSKKMNPFDMWKGANFILNVKDVAGWPNYDDSEFEYPEALFDGDDAKIEAVWKQTHSVMAEISEDKFKTYDVLKKQFEKVTGIRLDDGEADIVAEVESASRKGESVEHVTATVDNDDGDDDAEWFKKNFSGE